MATVVEQTPLERAAWAINDVFAHKSEEARERCYRQYEEHNLRVARAVLLAIREPSERMVEKWWDGMDDYYPNDLSVREGWRAMIDAALAQS